jgi:hypothetical protein
MRSQRGSSAHCHIPDDCRRNRTGVNYAGLGLRWQLVRRFRLRGKCHPRAVERSRIADASSRLLPQANARSLCIVHRS